MSSESALNFDKSGNLTPGILKNVTIEEFKQFFIESFAQSKTRERNYEGFRAFFAELKRIDVFEAITKIWVDGSYMTNKLDPNDIDFVFFLDAEHPLTLPALNHKNDFRQYGAQVHCDPYFLVDYETLPKEEVEARGQLEFQQKYWMGQFCFDRNQDPKGIIELKKSDLE
ncbi:DUF6932 family protein [Planomicrobium okeanokoites]|uniref:DUF6932 family protein n=1 Tax=Planomicrobium okeanokoites TaxID=244 RepID=UPI0009FE49C0|nr:hypothetical protein [Planomicrobium okeanokoites]